MSLDKCYAGIAKSLFNVS